MFSLLNSLHQTGVKVKPKHGKLRKTLNLRALKHLAYRLGIDEGELRRLCDVLDNDDSKLYRQFNLTRKGKKRPIATPVARLKRAQSRILTLLQELDFDAHIFGGIK